MMVALITGAGAYTADAAQALLKATARFTAASLLVACALSLGAYWSGEFGPLYLYLDLAYVAIGVACAVLFAVRPTPRLALGESPFSSASGYAPTSIGKLLWARERSAIRNTAYQPCHFSATAACVCYAIPSMRRNLLSSSNFCSVMTPAHSRAASGQSFGNTSPHVHVGIQEPSSFCEEISYSRLAATSASRPGMNGDSGSFTTCTGRRLYPFHWAGSEVTVSSISGVNFWRSRP